MANPTTNYSFAPFGFATSFPDADVPLEYSFEFKNLFTNSTGNSEKRPGLSLFSTIPTQATITGLHELILNDGTAVLFASGGGTIFKYNDEFGTWSEIFIFDDATKRIESFQHNKKLIFYNGSDRNTYTEDGEEFFDLRSYLEAGETSDVTAGTATSANGMTDNTVTNWVAGTDVVAKDIVYYPTLSAYGLITTVVSASLSHTAISGDATGLGKTNDGTVPVSGLPYEILDSTELNIVPVSGVFRFDNDTVIASGSNDTSIIVTKISDFTTTNLKVGDWIYNQTVSALTQVTAIATASIGVVGVSGQTAGDYCFFLKSSMPICLKGHTHFGRAYMVDAREPSKLRISAPNNTNDFGGSLAGTFRTDSIHESSERIRSITSFQRFFVIAGSKFVAAYEGTDPVGDSANNVAVDFEPIGLFPVGIVATRVISSIGNDLLFLTNNGVRKTTLKKSANQLEDESISAQLDKTLRDLIAALPTTDMQMFHYPRRSWVVLKAGSELYVYNYIQAKERMISGLPGQYGDTQTSQGAWHLFDGDFALQSVYFVRDNGDLVTGGLKGSVNIYDQKLYSDLGNPIPTTYDSSYQSMVKNQNDIRRKHGKSMRLVFEAPSNTNVNVKVRAAYDGRSTDSAILNSTSDADLIGSAIVGIAVIGGNRVSNIKFPLRWNGEVAKFTFETNTTTGPIIFSDYTVYYALMAAE